jgi:hypothetical protein
LLDHGYFQAGTDVTCSHIARYLPKKQQHQQLRGSEKLYPPSENLHCTAKRNGAINATYDSEV